MTGKKITFFILVVWLSSGVLYSPPEIKRREETVVHSHKIAIELFPEQRAFQAEDLITLESGTKTIALSLNKTFRVHAVLVEAKKAVYSFNQTPEKGRDLIDDNFSAVSHSAGVLSIDVQKAGRYRVTVSYSGEIYEEPHASRFSRDFVADQTAGLISPEGAFLSPESFWYPRGVEEMCRFEVITTSPVGYETVTQGERVGRDEKNGRLIVHWKNEHPADVCFLQAGPYDIQEDEAGSVRVYTYFFKGDRELAAKYLQKSMDYISFYSRLLGDYPYHKFAVVENFFETGYGMPSWTLLGKTVVRLPFIPDTSLPHEICHNWWGNGVFVDYAQGNWCEGLTVYCADYWLKKETQRGGDVEYRRQINRDYASYVQDHNDFPISEFRTRHDPATRAVGYGKTMMVYHDLQRKVGEDGFFRSLRRLMEEFDFKKADWKDVLGTVERECGVDLDGFYAQWITRPGAPVVRLKEAAVEKVSDAYQVSLTLNQEGEPYDLEVPVVVMTDSYKLMENISLRGTEARREFSLKAIPLRVEVDPEHHLFRRLYPEEIPPSLAKVFGTQRQLIVLGTQGEADRQDIYNAAARMIKRTETAEVKPDVKVSLDELKANAVLFLGKVSSGTSAAEFLNRVERDIPWERTLEAKPEATRVAAFHHPDDPKLAVLVIDDRGAGDVETVVRKLPHYGKYGYLLFHGETNVAKGVWDVESSPLIQNFDR